MTHKHFCALCGKPIKRDGDGFTLAAHPYHLTGFSAEAVGHLKCAGSEWARRHTGKHAERIAEAGKID